MPERARFWVGLHPDAPSDYVTIGGIAVQKFSFYPVTKTSPQPGAKPPFVRGNIARFSPDELARFELECGAWVVRFQGDPNGTGYYRKLVHMKRGEGHWRKDVAGNVVPFGGYRRQYGDYPIGCHVWCVRWDDRFKYNDSSLYPPRLFEFPEDVKPLVANVMGNLVRRINELEDPDNPTNQRQVIPIPGLGDGQNVHTGLRQMAQGAIQVEPTPERSGS